MLKRKKCTVKEEEKEQGKEWIDPYCLIPTGSTILNCSLSDNYMGGYKLGTIVNTIGDSGTGKTLLALNSLAEMALFKRFDDYVFKFDDAEVSLAPNLRQMFGKEMERRIEILRSGTIQDLYVNILKAIKDGRPFIYIVDSLDALTSKEEQNRADKMLKNKEKEEEGKAVKEEGSYKMEKAKMISEILRVVAKEIEDKEAFLNVISQTRDNIGWGYSDRTRSGGKALKFYCYHEMWISHIGTIKKLNEKIGSSSKIEISKNKLTFKKRTIHIPIFDNFGIDDVGSCVDYLVAEKIWTKDKQTIKAKHLGLEGTREILIKRIENECREMEVRELVGTTWNWKESQLIPDRKKRYL